MEALGVMGLVFGLVAIAKILHLEKTLKDMGVLGKDYKPE